MESIVIAITVSIFFICLFGSLCFTKWLNFVDDKDIRDYNILNQDLQSEIDYLRDELEEVIGDAAQIKIHSDGLQAKIDALMLEYCPNEMTDAQLAEYEKHQKPVSDEEAVKIDATIKEYIASTKTGRDNKYA